MRSFVKVGLLYFYCGGTNTVVEYFKWNRVGKPGLDYVTTLYVVVVLERGTMKKISYLLLLLTIALVLGALGCNGEGDGPVPTATPTEEGIYPRILQCAVYWETDCHELGFGIENNTSEAITIEKIEFYEQNGNIYQSIPNDQIIEIWETGEVEPGHDFVGTLKLTTALTDEELKGWQVKFYCIDSDEQPFNVVGTLRIYT